MVRRHSERLKLFIRGAVQGVGFRPFIYRLAVKLTLNGWVSNTGQGAFIEVEGDSVSIQRFLLRLEKEKPPRAVIQSFESSYLDPVGYRKFEIRESEEHGEKTTLILPDVATCVNCVREIFDPQNRRFRYPFTNCTNCGPRFTIIESLPYDRANTSMKCFKMCVDCEREYHDPLDRRASAGKAVGMCILIAGVGNVLRGDDGLGVEVFSPFSAKDCRRREVFRARERRDLARPGIDGSLRRACHY